MLDEDEYQKIGDLYSKCLRDLHFQGGMADRFKPVVDLYWKMTGFKDAHPNAILHHKISLYGPLCETCGKPYRTKAASFCAACGNKRENTQ